MLLKEILDRENGIITTKEMQEVKQLIDNAVVAMEKLEYLIGDVNFGCDYDTDNDIFTIWSRNAVFNYEVIEED